MSIAFSPLHLCIRNTILNLRNIQFYNWTKAGNTFRTASQNLTVASILPVCHCPHYQQVKTRLHQSPFNPSDHKMYLCQLLPESISRQQKTLAGVILHHDTPALHSNCPNNYPNCTMANQSLGISISIYKYNILYVHIYSTSLNLQ